MSELCTDMWDGLLLPHPSREARDLNSCTKRFSSSCISRGRCACDRCRGLRAPSCSGEAAAGSSPAHVPLPLGLPAGLPAGCGDCARAAAEPAADKLPLDGCSGVGSLRASIAMIGMGASRACSILKASPCGGRASKRAVVLFWNTPIV